MEKDGPLLLELEGRGYEGPHTSDEYESVDPVAIALEAWLARWDTRRPSPGSSPMVGFMQIEGGVLSGQIVVEVALREANEAGNRRKLRAADQEHKHLFVWIAARGDRLPWLALREEPSWPVMKLPEPLTGLWVAGDVDDGRACWLLEPPAAWRTFPVAPRCPRFLSFLTLDQ